MKSEKVNNDKKVISKRKLDTLIGSSSIYYFNNLENYYEFEEFVKLHKPSLLIKLQKASHIYLLSRNLFFNYTRFHSRYK